MNLLPKHLARLLIHGKSFAYFWGRRYSSVILRPYQNECIQECLTNLAQGRKRLGISLATGSGKTVIFTHLLSKVPPLTNGADQTLILMHRRELVDQAAQQCRMTHPDKTLDIEMAESQASGCADITVASIQSLISGDRLLKFDASRFKLILIDEAHHAASQSYLRVLNYFGASTPDTKVNVVGVSATLSRFDGLRLGTAMDYICFHRDYIDMVGEKWLCEVIFTTVATNVDLSKVKSNRFGDFQINELSKSVNTQDTNRLVVRVWLDRSIKDRKSTMIFCVDIAHVRELTNTFRRHGIDARSVTSETTKSDRKERIDAFRQRHFPVLVNCGVFTEGTDIPAIDCILLARPTRSRNLLVQMIGRGMRLYPGKLNCHVIDFVGSLAAGIVTVPTLFGLDPSEVVQEQSSKTLIDMAAERETAAKERLQVLNNAPKSRRIVRNINYTECSVHDLLGESTAELNIQRIRNISHLAWNFIGGSKYILSIPMYGYVKIEQDTDESFMVTEHRKLPGYMLKKIGHMNAKPRVIMDNVEEFEQAVHGADTFAISKSTRSLILRHATWRKAPASKAQVDFINKIRHKDRQFTAADLSKGVATDIITKIRHGAMAFTNAENKRVKKQSRLEEEARKVKRRERVEIGPV